MRPIIRPPSPLPLYRSGTGGLLRQTPWRIGLMVMTIFLLAMVGVASRSTAASADFYTPGTFLGCGTSVAVSGTTELCGAPNGNSGKGIVGIATLTNQTWSAMQPGGGFEGLAAADGSVGDRFGASLAFSGNTAVVGAPQDSCCLYNGGKVYVFTDSGGTWTQTAEFTDPSPTPITTGYRPAFGSSVAISGSTIIVGAPGEDSGVGATFIFSINNGVWSQTAKIGNPRGAAASGFLMFGTSVAISGATAVVGGNDGQIGGAYVYSSTPGGWIQTTELISNDPYSNPNFGTAVAISGNEIIVSADYGGSPGGVDGRLPGRAFVFVENSAGVWVQTAELAPSDSANGDDFGLSLAISGAVAVLGAPDANSKKGQAYVFTEGSDGTWVQTAEMHSSLPGSPNVPPLFGSSVSVSGDNVDIGGFNGGFSNFAAYSSNPVGPHFNGPAVYFDYAVGPNSAQPSGANVTVCGIDAQSTGDLEWWDPTANLGSGGWSPVVGDPGPTYSSGPPACASATLDASTSPTITQLTGTVFGEAVVAQVASPSIPSFVSSASTMGLFGTTMGYLVTAHGPPTASIGLAAGSNLPAGVTLTDNGDGTATLVSSPSASVGNYNFILQATNSQGATTQNFTLTINPPSTPFFSSASAASGIVGDPFLFSPVPVSSPPSSVSEAGTLPTGITFSSAELSGTPTQAGIFPITFTAHNGAGPDAVQDFTLTITLMQIATTALPSGTVYSKTNQATYSTTLIASGGNPPYKWSLAAGSGPLPPGLKLKSTGVIVGKAKAIGAYSFTVQVVDAKAKAKPHTRNAATAALSITIS